jgi:hypothetical protein
MSAHATTAKAATDATADPGLSWSWFKRASCASFKLKAMTYSLLVPRLLKSVF